MSEIKKMDMESKDLVSERIEQMKTLFPEIVTEGEGSIDFEKLRLILGDDVDEGEERYAFTWPGKADAIRQAQLTSSATLRPCIEESSGADGTPGGFDSENLYIEGDNLEVLKLLQKGYHGAVKMIYIDPPYNTGHDFVYKDKFGDTIANYREQAGLAGQANADTSGTYHSNWCSMMYPRLKLARELLRNDGLVFISIDDNELCNLMRLCDEIFGIDKLVSTFIWEKRKTRENRSNVSVRHDYVLCYGKIEGAGHQLGLEEMDEEAVARYKNPDNDARGAWTSVPAIAQGGHGTKSQFYTLHAPNGNTFNPPSGSCWRYTEDKMADLIADNKIWFGSDGNGVPRIKKFLFEGKQGLTPETLLLADKVGTNDSAKRELVALFDGDAVFETPKPFTLIEHLMTLAMVEDEDIVLDFFSGSSSTAHATISYCAKKNKAVYFVLIQIPEMLDANSVGYKAGYSTICEIGKERIRRAGAKIAAEVDESNRQLKLGEEPKQLPDIGFRVLKLDESGIAKPEPGQLIVDRVKPGRTDMDIIFEMMLKWGMDLTFPIEQIDCAGYPCYSVAADELICCLADGLTETALHAIAELEPKRVFLLDCILTDTLKLNAELIFGEVSERTQVEVDIRTV